jgi:hypothetical protein
MLQKMQLIVEIVLILLGLIVIGVAFLVVATIVLTAKVMEAVENERLPCARAKDVRLELRSEANGKALKQPCG